MRGAGSRSPTHATHGVPCLACTGESNLPPTRQEQSYHPSMQMVEAGGHSADSKRSGEYGYGRGYCWRAASVARHWRCLLSFAAENAAPCTAIRNRAGLQTAIGNSTGVFACLPYDERAGERGSDKALDGSERLRSNGGQAVGQTDSAVLCFTRSYALLADRGQEGCRFGRGLTR